MSRKETFQKKLIINIVFIILFTFLLFGIKMSINTLSTVKNKPLPIKVCKENQRIFTDRFLNQFCAEEPK